MPIYPLLALLAAWLLVELLTRAHRQSTRSWTPSRARALIVVVYLGTFMSALAFSSIYRHPHSRVAASRWIYANIEPGSVVAVEHWDDALPLPLDGAHPGSVYRQIQMLWFDADSQQKLQQALEWLDDADYIVLSSNRLYDSIPRDPERYPMTIRYYRALFDGSLGWNRVAEFTSYPKLLGIEFPDQRFEEAFTVYDHPRVQVFKKAPDYDAGRARTLLGEGIDW